NYTLMTEIIREIQEEDRPFCLELIQSCILHVNSRNYTPQFIKSLTESYSKNFMRRPERSTFVLEKDGILVGTGSIILSEGRINDMFIDVENHNKGFGKSLMAHLENIAQENSLKALFLYSSISGVNFYEKVGYTQVSQLDHGAGNIEIKMEKKLV
ncbi:unnamed protein product, partial [marine sediment metagenome]